MKPKYTLKIANSLEVLPTIPDNSVDSIVTDPPYELGFMGKSWDASGIAYNVTLWRECLRVLKPGGHLLAFSGSRTYHRMTCAIEDAGFQVRDQIMWVYGSGFPKSHNVSKAIDNPEAKQWDGWGTALKPAHEPICVARKPLEGTVADNVLKWGVGGLNVDGCRVGTEGGCAGAGAGAGARVFGNGLNGTFAKPVPGLGRWPANLIHDGSDEVLDLFPETAPSKKANRGNPKHYNGQFLQNKNDRGHDDDGGSAARFFYCAKASKKDRDDGCDGFDEVRESDRDKDDGVGGDNPRNRTNNPRKNFHPTVKPTDLMAYLCRLVTPPNGTILDPFTGSGSTGRGAILGGFNFIGIELSAEYAQIAEARIKAVAQL